MARNIDETLGQKIQVIFIRNSHVITHHTIVTSGASLRARGCQPNISNLCNHVPVIRALSQKQHILSIRCPPHGWADKLSPLLPAEEKVSIRPGHGSPRTIIPVFYSKTTTIRPNTPKLRHSFCRLPSQRRAPLSLPACPTAGVSRKFHALVGHPAPQIRAAGASAASARNGDQRPFRSASTRPVRQVRR
jgi:hypothetical protein